MTKLKEKPIHRVTVESLTGAYGTDSGRPLVVSMYAIGGKSFLDIRPLGTRQRVTTLVSDVYANAIRRRAGVAVLEKARAAKGRKAQRLAAQRQKRAERKLFTKS